MKLEIVRSTLRTEGGVVSLQSTPSRPGLPVVDVDVRESILSTSSRGDPLVRVDGQSGIEANRDRVRWEGRQVFYHRIETYRRDQSALPGSMAVRLDRPSWEDALATRDDSATHGDAGFQSAWTGARPIWSFGPIDARLLESSAARAAGADLARIPEAPSLANR
jgi:hypothetical protein